MRYIQYLKHIQYLALSLMIPILLAGCSNSVQNAEATNLVPSNANLIAQIQVSRILKDADLQSLYQKTAKGPDDPQNFDELLTRAQQETGVDFRIFTTATLFSDVTRNDEYFGLIARGPFNEKLLIEALNSSGNVVVSTEEYQGVRVHTAESDGKNPVFAVLDSDTSVMGTLLAVHDVIDVKQGKLAGISGPVYDAFNDLGTPLVGLAATMSHGGLAGLENSMGGDQGFGMIPAMDSLQDITIIALRFDRIGQDLQVEARLDFVNSDSASKMSSALDGLVSLALALSPDESVRYLLEKLDINVTSNTLTVSFQAPLSELEEATQAMKQNLGDGF